MLFFDRKPPSETPWTSSLWIYDLRTNQHFTLKTDPLTRSRLHEIVQRYYPDNRHERQETERFRSFSYEELLKRDKADLDIFWLRDESILSGSTHHIQRAGHSQRGLSKRKLASPHARHMIRLMTQRISTNVAYGNAPYIWAREVKEREVSQ